MIIGYGKIQISESLIDPQSYMTQRSTQAIDQGWFTMLSTSVTLQHNCFISSQQTQMQKTDKTTKKLKDIQEIIK